MSSNVLTDEELAILDMTRTELPSVPAFVVPTSTGTSTGKGSFIEPSWYKHLAYAMTDQYERGCRLYGPAGCGKSYAIRHLAKTVGANVLPMLCAKGMQIDAFIGTFGAENGTTKWIDGPLVTAIRNGSWLVAEEANTIDPGCWSIVNCLIDGTGSDLLLPSGESVPVSPAFRLALLYNEGSLYTGTKETNAALRRRLVAISADYENDSAILASITGASDAVIDRIVQLAIGIRAANLRFDLSPDMLARWIRMVGAGVGGWLDIYNRVIVDSVGAPEVTKAQRAVLAELASMHSVEIW